MSGKRKQWTRENMIEAIKACREKRMGYKKSAKTYNVPQTTLERYVARGEEPEKIVNERLGRKPVFSAQMEEELVNHCLELERNFFGVTQKDICRLAFELCEQNNIKNPFHKHKQCAGSRWLKSFINRHPILSFRKPQGISYARVKSFTKENVENFFNLYENVLEKVNNNPSRIFNCDEMGITIVQHKQQKVIALKGKKQVAALTSAERGALMTVVICFGATGQYIPPLIVFPRKNMKAELMNGMPPGAVSACHKSGWIQQEIFVQWFEHFVRHTKPTENDPVVLLLDGHYSHTRNLELINLARNNHVYIVCFPPHSTNKMQPLDVSFMSPFKTYYAQEIRDWLRQNPGRVVTVYQVGELFGRAYLKAATLGTAIHGFRKTGLFPVNRHVFKEHEFVAEQLSKEDNPVSVAELNHEIPDMESIEEEEAMEPKDNLFHVAPADLLPVPSLAEKIVIKKRSNAGKATIITSTTPYKKELEESLNKKNSPSTSKVKRQVFFSKDKNKEGQEKPTSKRKLVTRGKKRQMSSSSSDSSAEIFLQESDDSPNEDEDAECLFCNQPFSEDMCGELWLRCSVCLKWAHSECAGEKGKRYICDLCK